MTFNAASYFAGVGTVLATLTLGFGGGILMSGVFTDKTPREPSKIERHVTEKAKSEAPPAAATPVTPTIPKTEAVAAASPVPPPPEPQKEPEPPAPPAAQVQPQPQPPQPQVTTEVIRHPVPAQGRERPVALVHPAIREQTGAPHDDRAQDLKRQDFKRQAAEKRKIEREKQRAERRRQQQMQDAERRRQLQEAQASAAQRSGAAEVDDEEREERPVFGARERPVFARPDRPDFPRPRLFPWFGSDD